MSADWPLVPLGEVLSLREPDVEVHSDQEYHFAGVYCFGRGAFVGQKKLGREFSYPWLTRLRADNFVYPKLMAWEGAYATVPPQCDGLVVSTEFPVFQVNTDKLLPHFLELYFKQSSVWPELDSASTGTNVRRRRLNPSDFLLYQFPLPPLAEQRRIVARVEAVASRIAEAKRLQSEGESEINRLLSTCYANIIETAPVKPMSEVAPLVRRPVPVDPDLAYPQISARSFGKGTFHQPTLYGRDISWQKPFQVRGGDILISNIKAWEGAIAVVKPEDDGRFGSHRYLTCVPVAGVATARFVCFHLLTPSGLHHIGEASPGSADRNRTTSTKLLMQVPIPVPPYSDQLRFDALQVKADAIRTLQAETAAELDALLPAVLSKAFSGQL